MPIHLKRRLCVTDFSEQNSQDFALADEVIIAQMRAADDCR